MNGTITILGAGNLGSSIADGLLTSAFVQPSQLILTRRHIQKIARFKEKGCITLNDNISAVEQSDIVILAVEPHHANHVLDEIKPVLVPGKHTLISVITGLPIKTIKAHTHENLSVVRAMPNTAISIRESMTCICGEEGSDAVIKTEEIFNCVGESVIIREDQMNPATALAACGIAFFLRAIRAASQGGIQIGFHADIALKIAAQTARGAATLLKQTGNHPEHEIDRVTTPMGCTIAGLNQMEHDGFSSALIKGIVTSSDKANLLYTD
ncbi:pyrroline-5-carboxylate reductase [bacterium]|nr:MAG: pyrroline-5-carboxylate reductase [bacterium]